MRPRLTVFALTLLGLSLTGIGWGQEPLKPAESNERFLGLDAFAGGVAVPMTSETEAEKVSQQWGWEAGATVSYGVRWLGLTGTIAHYNVARDMGAYHLLVGPRLTSPWAVGEGACRIFAHALWGLAQTGQDAPHSNAEWVLGGGLDLLLFRMQFDRVRLNLAGVHTEDFRAFVGGVIPLCLRGCRQADMALNISGRPATK